MSVVRGVMRYCVRSVSSAVSTVCRTDARSRGELHEPRLVDARGVHARAPGASRDPRRRAAMYSRARSCPPRHGTVSVRSSNRPSRTARPCARSPACLPPARRRPRHEGSRWPPTRRRQGPAAPRAPATAFVLPRIAVDNTVAADDWQLTRRSRFAAGRPEPPDRERESLDHRHRRPVGRRQGHGRARDREAARLPPRRHRRDVSRAGVEGAARRRRSRRRSRGLRRSPQRAHSTSATGGSGSTATTSRGDPHAGDGSRGVAVARQPRVREVLVARQRELGAPGGIVMEGRDIGTVVFPAADVKIYLDASPEERARRRATDPAHASGNGRRRDSGSRDRARRARSARPHARRVAAAVAADAVVDRHDGAVDRRGGRARDGVIDQAES